MPRVGFEPTILVFERAKTLHALVRNSNYYLSQNIQYILYSVRANSMLLFSSGAILLYSMSISLLK
jgi:hypothetical protein